MTNIDQKSSFSPFRSAAAKSKYLSFYKMRAMKWSVSFEEKMFHTSFGETYVRICGPKGAQPLVLMHGGGDNSSSWAPNIEPLAQNYRIYAVDAINYIQFFQRLNHAPAISCLDSLRHFSPL